MFLSISSRNCSLSAFRPSASSCSARSLSLFNSATVLSMSFCVAFGFQYKATAFFMVLTYSFFTSSDAKGRFTFDPNKLSNLVLSTLVSCLTPAVRESRTPDFVAEDGPSAIALSAAAFAAFTSASVCLALAGSCAPFFGSGGGEFFGSAGGLFLLSFAA